MAEGAGRDRQRTARRLLGLARPEARLLAVATVALLLGSAASLVAPQGLRLLIDALTHPGNGQAELDRTLLWLLAVFAAVGVLGFARATLFTLAGERVVARLRRRLFARVLDQEVAFFDAQRTGDLLSRLSADTGLLQNAVTINVSMGLRYVVGALGTIGVLFWTSPRLTLAMLAVVPLVAAGAVAFARAVRRASRQAQDALAEASAVADEALGSIRTVRSFAREQTHAAHYDARIDRVYAAGRRMALIYGAFQGWTGFLGYAGLAGILWYGGRLVLQGALSVGTLTSFLVYTLALAFSMAGLSSLFGDFQRALGASERVFELLERAPLLPPRGGERPARCDGHMRLEGIAFAYPTRPDAQVLHGIDLELAPGKVVALVGASGSGKSTVAALLLRFYDPASGRVTLDGRDLRELDPDWVREQVGLVAQEPVLFADSIEENIRYGRPGATRAQVEEAARAANAHDFVSALPDGYATMVGERGVRLSGGQRQRIAIARALLKDPRVLLLDEATSALDAESEYLVQQALERLMRGRAVLVIAHRLSTVRTADKVMVLAEGRVIEDGSHDELLEKNGAYRRLVERQFAA
jgi:ATP-binding cassette subfamily B protein